MSASNDTASAVSQDPPRDHRWLILVIVSVAQLMVVLDSTIVNIALPSAQADLGFADSDRQWIVTAYALAFGSMLLLGGRIGDLIGRKWAFLAGMTGFAVASALGGAADSFTVLVIARTVQGLAAALLAPAALSTLIITFHDPRERGRAFGVFGSVAVSGGAVGLILGGVLTEYLSWRWAMYVNVFFAAVAAAGALLYMTSERPATRPRIDLLGTVLISAGLFCLVFGFSRAETAGWSDAATLLSLALSVLLLASFLIAESRVSSPLLPLRILTDRARAVAYAVIWIAGVAMFAVFLFLTFYLQLVKGMSPVLSGVAFLPLMGAIMASSNFASVIGVPRYGPRAVMTAGMIICCVSLAYLGRLDIHAGYASGVLPTLIGLGLGVGMVVPPAMNIATAGVDHHDAGVASALTNTVQQVGGSVGTAVLSTVAATTARSFAHHHPHSPGASAVTHGYVAAFVISAVLFGVSAAVVPLLSARPTQGGRRASPWTPTQGQRRCRRVAP